MKLNKLDRNQMVFFAGKKTTINQFLIDYDLEYENEFVCLTVINNLVNKGSLKLIEQESQTSSINENNHINDFKNRYIDDIEELIYKHCNTTDRVKFKKMSTNIFELSFDYMIKYEDSARSKDTLNKILDSLTEQCDTFERIVLSGMILAIFTGTFAAEAGDDESAMPIMNIFLSDVYGKFQSNDKKTMTAMMGDMYALAKRKFIADKNKEKAIGSQRKNCSQMGTHDKKNNSSISFDECLRKHFPMQASTLSVINEISSIHSSLYEMTLETLKDYKGDYELEDIYLGALIIHVRLGNISGFNIDELFEELNWSIEFKYDVMNGFTTKTVTKPEKQRVEPKIKVDYDSKRSNNSFQDKNTLSIKDNISKNNIEHGNTSGNINNGGRYGFKGNYIYSAVTMGGQTGIYKEQVGNGKPLRIYEGEVNNLNIVGDWVYFNKYGSILGGIGKVKTDGSSFTTIDLDRAIYMHVAGDWIYYCKSVKKGLFSNQSDLYLCKIKTDGSNKTQLGKIGDYNFVVWDNWIYFRQSGLRRMMKDGTNLSTILEGSIYNVNIVDGTIYYMENFCDFYKCDLEGNKRVHIFKIRGTSYRMNVTGKWIYYIKEDDGLYRLSIDGNKNEKIVDSVNNNSELCVAGNRVIYIKGDRFYSINV